MSPDAAVDESAPAPPKPLLPGVPSALSPLVRRIAAIMLITMFVSAVFAFGKIDLIGHSLIVVALLGIIVDDGGKPARIRDFWLMPAAYIVSLALFLGT